MLASVLTQERKPAPLSVAVPLASPDVEAAMEFLTWMVPPTVFSSGSGRRRRRGASATMAGRRSEQGFVLFYRSAGADQAMQVTPLKSPRSIEAYLRRQLGAPLAEHWVAVQTTQFQGRRDGQAAAGGFTAATSRHVLGIVLDLDGKRMDPLCRVLLEENLYAFRAILAERLASLGVDAHLMVRSSSEGVHVYVPLERPDGRPLRATERTLEIWGKVARALARYLADMGADENAVRPTQPFAIPGIPRLKHGGFIPYVCGGQNGARANLFTLLRALAGRKLVAARERAVSPSLPSPDLACDLEGLLAAVKTTALGVGSGQRNKAAHDLCTFLLAKGATEVQVWDAVTRWNRRNAPPLSEMELRGCLRSALRCPDRYPRKWAEMQIAPWARLRELLGLPEAPTTGYRRNGRWRPLTPSKPWEVRKATPGGREHYEEVEERLLRFLAGEGGRVETTQAEIAGVIDTNAHSLRAVVNRLVAAQRVQRISKRGRGGTTVLVLLQPDVGLTENVASRYSTGGAESGVWVGESVSAPADALPLSAVSAVAFAPVRRFSFVSVPASSDAVAVAADLLGQRLGTSVVPLDWFAVWREPGRCVLVGRTAPSDRLLRVFQAFGCAVELGRRLGGVQVELRLREVVLSSVPGTPADIWDDTEDGADEEPPW